MTRPRIFFSFRHVAAMVVCLVAGHERDPHEKGVWDMLPLQVESGICQRCQRRYFVQLVRRPW